MSYELDPCFHCTSYLDYNAHRLSWWSQYSQLGRISKRCSRPDNQRSNSIYSLFFYQTDFSGWNCSFLASILCKWSCSKSSCIHSNLYHHVVGFYKYNKLYWRCRWTFFNSCFDCPAYSRYSFLFCSWPQGYCSLSFDSASSGRCKLGCIAYGNGRSCNGLPLAQCLPKPLSYGRCRKPRPWLLYRRWCND